MEKYSRVAAELCGYSARQIGNSHGSSYDQGTPVPLDESAGGEAAGGRCWITPEGQGVMPIQMGKFLDAEGKLGAAISLATMRSRKDKSQTTSHQFKSRWIRGPKPLWPRRELHRSWILLCSAEKSGANLNGGPAGPMAVPGNYIVKLTRTGMSSRAVTIKWIRASRPRRTRWRGSFKPGVKLAARLGEVSMALRRDVYCKSKSDARKKEARGNKELLWSGKNGKKVEASDRS